MKASITRPAAAHGASVDAVLGDYIVLEETAVVPIPEGLTYEEASTLPTAGLTGWMAVASHRAIRPGGALGTGFGELDLGFYRGRDIRRFRGSDSVSCFPRRRLRQAAYGTDAIEPARR